MSDNLNNIIGLEIIEIRRGKWITLDGYSACNIYALLSNQTLVLFSDFDPPVGKSKLPKVKSLTLYEDQERFKDYLNNKITDVVKSELWPTIGIVIEDRVILHLS